MWRSLLADGCTFHEAHGLGRRRPSLRRARPTTHGTDLQCALPTESTQSPEGVSRHGKNQQRSLASDSWFHPGPNLGQRPAGRAGSDSGRPRQAGDATSPGRGKGHRKQGAAQERTVKAAGAVGRGCGATGPAHARSRSPEALGDDRDQAWASNARGCLGSAKTERRCQAGYCGAVPGAGRSGWRDRRGRACPAVAARREIRRRRAVRRGVWKPRTPTNSSTC